MSMSTRVTAFRPPGEKWQKMAAIWQNCAELKIDPPAEVEEFFDGDRPDPAGVEVRLPHRGYESDMSLGVEVNVSDIPEGATVIRFVNSW